LQESRPFGGQSFLTLTQRPIFFLDLTDSRYEVFEPLFKALQFQFDRGFRCASFIGANIERAFRNAKATLAYVRYYCAYYAVGHSISGFRGRFGRRRQHGRRRRSARIAVRRIVLHGALQMQDWINEILPDGASLSEESSAMIERVFSATATSFGEQGMEFEPLLPDDEQPLNGRANALALWCTGFLYGLGAGQISDLEALNGEVGEIVVISPRFPGPPVMTPTRMNPTNRHTRNWSSSSGSRPRWYSRNYCRCADRCTRRPSSGCTERIHG
jgi:hypothetical protein